jgi:hypothetical protein
MPQYAMAMPGTQQDGSQQELLLSYPADGAHALLLRWLIRPRRPHLQVLLRLGSSMWAQSLPSELHCLQVVCSGCCHAHQLNEMLQVQLKSYFSTLLQHARCKLVHEFHGLNKAMQVRTRASRTAQTMRACVQKLIRAVSQRLSSTAGAVASDRDDNFRSRDTRPRLSLQAKEQKQSAVCS